MKALHKAALIGAALMLYSAGAAAQLTNQGLLDQVVTEFATRAAAWQSIIMNAATWLFWTLGTISLVWTGGMMALRKADIGEFFAEFTRFILFFGFFLWLLRNGPSFASSIIQSLQRLGEQASGVSSITPSGIVDIGFLIWKQAVTNLSIWSPVDSFIGTALSSGVLIMLALIAVNMLLLLVAAWILMYAGIFFLGFGGSRWTSDMAINYYKTVLGIAAQLMSMVLLVGIGNDLLSTFYAKMNKGALNFEELGIMLVFCVALLALVNRIPPLIAGIVSGTGVGAAGGIGNFGVGAAVGAAMGAAGMAMSAASMAGTAVMSGTANIAGGASAIKAAFEKAAGAMSTEGGGMTDTLSAAISGGGVSGGGETGTSTPFAEAAGFSGSSRSSSSSGSASMSSNAGGKAEGGDAKGKSGSQQTADGVRAKSQSAGGPAHAAAVTASAAGELAKGAGSVLKDKAAQLAEGFQERVTQTPGGQVAAAIKARMFTQDAPAFEGNSLAGERPADVDDEVAAFVSRSSPA